LNHFWKLAQKQAFRSLLAAFTQALILMHFDFNRIIQLKTDTFDFAIAAILLQPNNEGE